MAEARYANVTHSSDRNIAHRDLRPASGASAHNEHCPAGRGAAAAQLSRNTRQSCSYQSGSRNTPQPARGRGEQPEPEPWDRHAGAQSTGHSRWPPSSYLRGAKAADHLGGPVSFGWRARPGGRPTLGGGRSVIRSRQILRGFPKPPFTTAQPPWSPGPPAAQPLAARPWGRPVRSPRPVRPAHCPVARASPAPQEPPGSARPRAGVAERRGCYSHVVQAT